MIRYADRGSRDVLHLGEVYTSHHRWDCPSVPAYHGHIPERLVPWPNRKRAAPEDGLHFFVDDDRFEPVWKNPGLSRAAYEGRVVCSPDFSLWPEMPEAMKIWNVYRARWLARALHERGAIVIPSVSWCPGFLAMSALPFRSVVAISAYGAKRAGEHYRAGYDAMVRLIDPERVVVVGGVMPDWLAADERVTYRAAGTIADRR